MPTRVVSTRRNSKNRKNNIHFKTLKAKLYELLLTDPVKFDEEIGNLTKSEKKFIFGKLGALRLTNNS